MYKYLKIYILEEVFAFVNNRSFLPLMNCSTFEISCSVHRVAINGLSSIEVRNQLFSDKSNRRNFIQILLKYSKKLLKWKHLTDGTPGYEISLKPKPEISKYLIVKIWRIGLAQAEAISILARNLKIKETDISFAGTKDAKAEIIQHFSLKNCEKSAILRANFGEKLRILDVVDGSRHLNLGEISSNVFQIRIELGGDIPSSPNVRKFLNYFGLQRFGLKHAKILKFSKTENLEYLQNSMPIFGILLIVGNYRQAGLIALKPTPDADQTTRLALTEFSNLEKSEKMSKTEIQKIIKKLHPGRKVELSILKAISAQIVDDDLSEIDFEKVWKSVNFRTKQFIVMSGSSLLWNKAVSENKEDLEQFPFLGSAGLSN